MIFIIPSSINNEAVKMLIAQPILIVLLLFILLKFDLMRNKYFSETLSCGSYGFHKGYYFLFLSVISALVILVKSPFAHFSCNLRYFLLGSQVFQSISFSLHTFM